MERPRASERTGAVRCPYCHDALGDGPTAACEGCSAAHHRACWDEHGGCATCRAKTAEVRLEQVPPRLTVTERDGALSIVRHIPEEGGWLAVSFLLGLGLASSFLTVMGVRLIIEGDERSGGLFMAAVCGLFAWAFLAGALEQAGGQVGLTIDREAVRFRHRAFGIPLSRPRAASRGAVSEVRAAGESLVVVHAGGAMTWTDLTPEETAWIAARVRKELGLP